MARAAVSVRSIEPTGNDIVVELYIVFFGAEMAKPDATIVNVTSTMTDTPAVWRSRRNAAIQSEADRIGVSWNGRIISEADLLRDA